MDEYIARKTAVKQSCDYCNAMYEEDPCEPSECLIMQALRSIPAADVQLVRVGKWVDSEGNLVGLDEEGCTNAMCWCSECGDWLTGSDEYSVRGRFCPNCGAKML